jgi:hypothetical protein
MYSIAHALSSSANYDNNSESGGELRLNKCPATRVISRGPLPSSPADRPRSCWLAYGYLQAMGDCDVIALHDCDIVNYDRRMLARLCYPIVHPQPRIRIL